MSAGDYIGRTQAVRGAIQAGTRVRIAVITGISQASGDAWTKQLDTWIKTFNSSSDVVVYGSAGNEVSAYAAYLSTALTLTPKPDMVLLAAGIADHVAQTALATFHSAIASLASSCNAAGVVPVYMYDNDYADAKTGTHHLIEYFDSCYSTGASSPFGGDYYTFERAFVVFRRPDAGFHDSEDDRSGGSLDAILEVDGITPNTAGHALIATEAETFFLVKRLYRDDVGHNALSVYMEHTILVDVDGTAHLFAAEWDGPGIVRFTSTNYDSASPTWTSQGLCIAESGLIEAQAHRGADGYYYMVTRLGHSNRDVPFYLYRSAHCVTWEIMNNGNPLLTTSANPMRVSGYNPAVWVDTDAKVAHLVYESYPEDTGSVMGIVGMAYGSAAYSGTLSPTTALTFTVGTSWTIPGALWPTLQFVPGKGWLAVAGYYGDLADDGGTTFCGNSMITAFWAVEAADLSAPASWSRGWPFQIRCEGVLCGDPNSFVAMPDGKDAKTLISFSYSQTPNSAPDGIRQVYSDWTIAELFDLITGAAAAYTDLICVMPAMSTYTDLICVMPAMSMIDSHIIDGLQVNEGIIYAVQHCVFALPQPTDGLIAHLRAGKDEFSYPGIAYSDTTHTLSVLVQGVTPAATVNALQALLQAVMAGHVWTVQILGRSNAVHATILHVDAPDMSSYIPGRLQYEVDFAITTPPGWRGGYVSIDLWPMGGGGLH